MEMSQCGVSTQKHLREFLTEVFFYLKSNG